MDATRCPAHGLIVVADGRCSRCRRDEERTNSTRIYALFGVVAFCVLIVLGLWRAVGMRAASATSASDVPAAAADPGERVVTVYTTAHCPWCKKAKTWLNDHHVAYTERQVDDDPAAAAEMRRVAGGTGVPTFVVGGEVQRGYSVAWLEKTFPPHP